MIRQPELGKTLRTIAKEGRHGFYTGSVADGTFKLEPDVTWGGLNPAGPKKLNATYGFSNGVFSTYTGSTALLDSQFPPAELEFQKGMASWGLSPLAPPAPLTTTQQQSATLTGNALMSTVQSQTLQFIYDVQRAVQGLRRMLKPGGVALCSVAGISQISRYDMDRWGDHWRFTSLSAQTVFAQEFGLENVEVETFGNVLTMGSTRVGAARVAG